MKNKSWTLSIIKKKNFQSNFFQQGVDFFCWNQMRMKVYFLSNIFFLSSLNEIKHIFA